MSIRTVHTQTPGRSLAGTLIGNDDNVAARGRHNNYRLADRSLLREKKLICATHATLVVVLCRRTRTSSANKNRRAQKNCLNLQSIGWLDAVQPTPRPPTIMSLIHLISTIMMHYCNVNAHEQTGGCPSQLASSCS